ncbi:ATP-binding protein [Amycolatopsis jiangsuensis]|uniref:Serine/threonine-protein kinase RsbW n=1 Tax=Amycolatopsis jiangsuensis TaxID=1181879 RepID=A0A840ILQ2_9PSEU|nr:ATP-binding protein [Amycolatopsis jiangsuensis]MBB4683271.1 serine/threonine-protein kinase RsbW [Amycolatopsis jiangsuensis]
MDDEGPGGSPLSELPAARRPLDEVIELRLPADTDQIPLVRMLAQAVAARSDYGLDAIADVQMAVDEACAQLVGAAEPGATMACRFRTGVAGVHLTVETRTRHAQPPGEHTFGWHVLSTLARSVAAQCLPEAGGGYLLCLDLDLSPETTW